MDRSGNDLINLGLRQYGENAGMKLVGKASNPLVV
jgi:hypothetical protein